MSIIYIIVLFFVCMILYKPGFRFFLLWLGICAAVFFFLSESAGLWGVLVVYGLIAGHDIPDEKNTSSKSSSTSSSSSIRLYDKVYEDGSHRVDNLSKTGYYYSGGSESWVGMLGEEHRENGEVVRDNAYLSGRRDIYNAAGEYVGYEYEDSVGITHRVDKHA